jgi:hypothetical protein
MQRYDFEAAFPTAVFVAAARGHDAKSATPLIGRTVDGGVPDHCANVFVNEEGVQLFHDFCEFFGLPPDTAAEGIATRTAYIDELFMTAHRDGIRQFVSVGSGLDARPWRLPLNEHAGAGAGGATSVVFELDCPEAIRFKESRVALLDPITSPLRCSKRVPVEVDLSDTIMLPGALIAAAGCCNRFTQPTLTWCYYMMMEGYKKTKSFLYTSPKNWGAAALGAPLHRGVQPEGALLLGPGGDPHVLAPGGRAQLITSLHLQQHNISSPRDARSVRPQTTPEEPPQS